MSKGIVSPPPEPDGTEGTATVTLTLKDNEKKKTKYTCTALIISSLHNEDFKNFLNTDTKNAKFFIYFCSIDLPESWKDSLVKCKINVYRFTKPTSDKSYTIDQNAAKGILVDIGYHIFLPLIVGKFTLRCTRSKFRTFLNDYSKNIKCDQQQIDCQENYKGLMITEKRLVKFNVITFLSDNNRLKLRDELFDKLVDGPLLLCSNGKDHAVGWCAKARDNSSKITWYKFKPDKTEIWRASCDQSDSGQSHTGASDPSLPPQPEASDPSQLRQPEASDPSQLRQPEASVPSQLRQPEASVPSQLRQPEASVPSQLRQPEASDPSQLRQPEASVPSQLRQPEASVPSQLRQPEASDPSQLRQPEASVPSQLRQPEASVPSQPDQGISNPNKAPPTGTSGTSQAGKDSMPKGETKKDNFIQLHTLVFEEGTKVLRMIFDEKRDIILEQFNEDPSLERKLKRSLNPKLIAKLIAKGFPSEDCDITCLCVLLSFADLEPEKSAAIDQIRKNRNMLAHPTDLALSYYEFERRWTEIADALVELGGEKCRPRKFTLKAAQDEKGMVSDSEDLEDLQQEWQIINGNMKESGTGHYKLYRPLDSVGSQQQGQNANQDLDLVTLLDSDESIGDGLALRLDHEYQVSRNWRHLANEMGAPDMIIQKCKNDTVHSPTLLLLKYPNVSCKNVDELVKKLKQIGRKDLVNLLHSHIPKANQGKSLNDTLLKMDGVLDKLACKLDLRSRVNKNWRDLGKLLGLKPWRLDLIEKGNNPTKDFLLYVYRDLHVTAGKFRQIIDGFKDRSDVVKLLDEYKIFPEDNRPLKDVIKPESEAMRKVCECLNNNLRGVLHDWKNVACKLEIPYETYSTFDPPERSSPTKELLDWVRSDQDLMSVYKLLDYLRNIERNDARAFLLDKRDEYLRKQMQAAQN